MVTINPQDVKPDEVYEGAAVGERWIMQRVDVDSDTSFPWHASRFDPTREYCVATDWHSDTDVSDLVRLVPAREVTLHDLPDFGAMGSVMARWKVPYGAVSDVLDAVVEHLNANGGLPTDDVNWEMVATDLQGERNEATDRAESAEGDRDRWRRAHSIVEQELDQAREQAAKMCRERDGWRECAEAAEARTAPAITREDVEAALKTWSRPGMGGEPLVDLVCRLFGVEAEPADQVLAKSHEFATLVDWEMSDREANLLLLVARHVLGQEGSDVDR